MTIFSALTWTILLPIRNMQEKSKFMLRSLLTMTSGICCIERVSVKNMPPLSASSFSLRLVVSPRNVLPRRLPSRNMLSRWISPRNMLSRRFSSRNMLSSRNLLSKRLSSRNMLSNDYHPRICCNPGICVLEHYHPGICCPDSLQSGRWRLESAISESYFLWSSWCFL